MPKNFQCHSWKKTIKLSPLNLSNTEICKERGSEIILISVKI